MVCRSTRTPTLWRQLYKIGLPGKSILGDYFEENKTSRSPFLLLRISFPGRPIFIQFIPDLEVLGAGEAEESEDQQVEGLRDGHRKVA